MNPVLDAIRQVWSHRRPWHLRFTLMVAITLPVVAIGQNPGAGSSTDIQLFQPGQVSWEWLLIPSSHGSGAQAVRQGTACLTCHEGEESLIGDAVISRPGLEPGPISGLPGFIDLSVQATVSDGLLQLRLSWPDLSADGAAGGSEYPARVTATIAGRAQPTVYRYSCWSTCHSDLPGMSDPAASRLSKYLPNSRSAMTRTGGGDSVRPDGELAGELARGAFLEYWNVSLAAADRAHADDGYFLQSRIANQDPALTATARSEGGERIVELQRPLAAQGDTRIPLEPGESYSIAFAVYERNTEGRRHFVSFPLELSIETDSAGIDGLYD